LVALVALSDYLGVEVVADKRREAVDNIVSDTLARTSLRAVSTAWSCRCAIAVGWFCQAMLIEPDTREGGWVRGFLT